MKKKMNDTVKSLLVVLFMFFCMVAAVYLCSLAAGCSSQDMKTVETLWKTATMIQNNACNGVDGGPSLASLACVLAPHKCYEINEYCALADISRAMAIYLADIVNEAIEAESEVIHAGEP